MQANHKGIVITLSAILIIAFFMPWVNFFVSVNAWDMVFGEVGELIQTSFRYVAVIIPLAGMLILYGTAFNNGKYILPKQLLFFLPLLTLIIIAIAIGINVGDSDEEFSTSNIGDILSIFGIGFWVTLVGSIVLPFFSSATESQLPAPGKTITQESSPVEANQNLTPSQPISQPAETKPAININLPKVDWGKTFSATRQFVTRHRIWLGVGAGLIIIFFIVYNLFIKADPVKDGKNLAKMYCNCTEEWNKSKLASLQSFLNEFGEKKYKSRKEAKDSLNFLESQNLAKYNNCTQQAELKYRERYADYSAKKGKNAYTFQQTYSSITGSCINNFDAEVTNAFSNAQAKIKTIIDPEPDIEKIKGDLIGRQIPGWTFSYLSQYKSASFTNQFKNTDRIEYQVKFNLVGNQPTDEHECEVVVVYLQNDDGWFLDNVSMNYITYINTLYPDRYIAVHPLQNCTWNAENNYKISWKTSDWDYASETVTGPDKGAVTLPGSTVYFLKSLEPNEIKVKFTYRLNH